MKIRSSSAVVRDKFIIDIDSQKVDLGRSHFSSHCNAFDLFVMEKYFWLNVAKRSFDVLLGCQFVSFFGYRSEVKALCFGLAEFRIVGLFGKIGKKGRMEIRTETFGNYFALETPADEIDLTTRTYSLSENVDR